MPQLLGRQLELARIAAFATGAEGYLRMIGAAFAGKTALLYEAVTVGLPDEVDVVCYFLSRRSSDATSDRFLEAVVPQLAYLCEVEPPVADVHQYLALWQQAADRAAQSGRHLLLAVDGLDEDLRPPGSPSIASLLPTLAGAHAHVLVTSRPHPGLPDDVPARHPLRATPTQLVPFSGAQQLAKLASQEIRDLTHGDDSDLAVEILGLLTAAAGPLSVSHLVALRSDGRGAPTASDTRTVRRLVEDRAARSVERIGPMGKERYQFAHFSLFELAQSDEDLSDPEYRRRIEQWADRWKDAGWPGPGGEESTTPLYLLDSYPLTLKNEPTRRAALVEDIGWVSAAVQTLGVDPVLGTLDAAQSAGVASADVSALLATLRARAPNLRPPQPIDQPGYVLEQLATQAAELGEDRLAADAQARLRALPGYQADQQVPAPVLTGVSPDRGSAASGGKWPEETAELKPLSTEQLRMMHNAVLESYDRQTLEMKLFELDRRLDVISPPGSLSNVVFRLLQTAQREGWMIDLLRMFKESSYPAVREAANRILTHNLPSQDRAETPTPDLPAADPYLIGRQPFIDRNVLRMHLKDLLSDSESRVLMITGERPCGKSYTWRYVNQPALLGGVIPVLVDLADSREPLSPLDIMSSIALQLGLPEPTIDRYAQETAQARRLRDWLVGQLQQDNPDGRWLMVFDSLDHIGQREETLQLIEFLAGAAIRQRLTGLRVILLGYTDRLLLEPMESVLIEEIQDIGAPELLEFYRWLAQRENLPITEEAIDLAVQQVLSLLPDDRGARLRRLPATVRTVGNAAFGKKLLP